MNRRHILIGAQRSTFVPPNHPNWTARSHRTLADAYGSSISGTWSQRPVDAPSLRGAIVGCFFAAAIVGFLFVGPIVFSSPQ